jgi:hypothetical protein
VYVETQTDTTNANGLVSIQIGTGTATTGTFAGINWANGPYFIKTETDPTGGINYTITGTQEMLSVPYAMYAAKSGDPTTMGAIGGSSSTNGATINAGVLSLTPADAAKGGIVTNGTQTIGGAKTFTQSVTANSFVKTGGTSSLYLMADGSTSAGTEATTMGAVRASSTINGGTITSGVLSLAPADATNAGIVTTEAQTIAGSKTFSSVIKITAGYPGVGKVLTSDETGQASWENYRTFTTAGPGISVSGTGTSIDPYIVSSKIYTIGLWPELGGYVFRISADGRHGLVAETQNQLTSWYEAQNAISNPGNHSTNGKKFMDWRLPTRYELNEMYLQKLAIGGLGILTYWSSTERVNEFGYDGNAWFQSFDDGYQNHFTKSEPYYVRAVRAF